MKKLFFILTLAACAVFFQKAGASGCSTSGKPPKVEFYTSYGKLSYDFSKSQREVTAIARQSGILERGLFASGLATIQVAWEINVNTISEISDEGEICVFPTSVDVFIGFQNPMIYLADNLKEGTCRYNVVLRHEQTHQQINKAALDYFLPAFYQKVQQIAKSIPPETITSVADINAATDRLSHYYTQKISPLIDNFKRGLLTEQGKLDNQSNYIHEADLCASERK